MLALIAAAGLLAGSILSPDTRGSTPTTWAQVSACPPCVDQLPPAARVIETESGGPDASGAVETLVAYFVRDPSFGNIELGRLGAIAVRTEGGRSQVFKLGDDLGENPYAALEVRDITADGGNELVLTTAVGAHSMILRIFRWNGGGYPMLEEFFGDSGVGLVDVEPDGVAEVMVGMRHYDRAQTRSDTVLRWNGRGYAPEYSRWGFTFDDSTFQEYPEAVVLRYYLSIDGRDFRRAWSLLGPGMQGGQSFDGFVGGFDATQDVRVEDLEVMQEEDTRATVRVEESTVNRDGSVHRFQRTWLVERSGGGPWRLAGAYTVPI